jgi:hypothetical protein
MRVCLVFVAHALLRGEPQPKDAAKDTAPKLAKITESLKKVQSGLSALPNPPAGLAGLLTDIDSTLVKLASTAVSDAEKMVSASSVMHAIGEFKAMLTERQDELEAESHAAQAFKQRADHGEGDGEEDLFKALLNAQDVPMDQQEQILSDKKYAALSILPAVKNITEGDTLAVKLGLALDARDVAERKALSHPHPQSKSDKLAAIAKALESRESRVEEELKEADQKEEKREKQIADSAKLEKSMGAAASKSMGQAEAALKFFNLEAKHAFLKKEATMKKEAGALKAAVNAIHKGDVPKIQAALEELKSMGPSSQPLA